MKGVGLDKCVLNKWKWIRGEKEKGIESGNEKKKGGICFERGQSGLWGTDQMRYDKVVGWFYVLWMLSVRGRSICRENGQAYELGCAGTRDAFIYFKLLRVSYYIRTEFEIRWSKLCSWDDPIKNLLIKPQQRLTVA